MPLDRTTNNVKGSNFRMEDSKSCSSGNDVHPRLQPTQWEMQIVLAPAHKFRRQACTAEYRKNGTAGIELP
jgi:hypothetical protein